MNWSGSLLRLARAARGGGVYSHISYALGGTLAARHDGTGPVAWVRGFPRPVLRAAPGGRIELGHVGLHPGVVLRCGAGALLTVGDRTFINRRSRVSAAREVRIGCGCMISWDVIVMDGDGFADTPPEKIAPVLIGDRVWIGARCVILGGTRLGVGCIVAAGSVVQGVYPPGAVVAGEPAQVAA